jgi:hypothetical protein
VTMNPRPAQVNGREVVRDEDMTGDEVNLVLAVVEEGFDEPDEALVEVGWLDSDLLEEELTEEIFDGLDESLADVDLTELLLDADPVELLLSVDMIEFLLDADLAELLLGETLTEILLELLDVLVDVWVFAVIHLQASLTAGTFELGMGESCLLLCEAVSITEQPVIHTDLLRSEKATERRWILEFLADCIRGRTCRAHRALQACCLCDCIECSSPCACWFSSGNTLARVQ